MKRIVLTLLSVVFMILGTSCTQTVKIDDVSLDANSVAEILVTEMEFSEELTKISSNVLAKRYGLDEEMLTDAVGYAGTRAVVDEITVFKSNDTDAVLEAARAHIDAQIKNYTSYAPNEVPKLNDAAIEVIGDCVIVCVSKSDSAVVKSIIGALAE